MNALLTLNDGSYGNFQLVGKEGRFRITVEAGVFTSDPLPFAAGDPCDHDLKGKYLLPKFVDAHCHILPTGLDLLKLDLTGLSSVDEVLDALKGRHQEQPEGWLLAVQYDQNRLPNGEHLTRFDLDKVSATRPILLRHSNGHAGACNSAALQAAGISASAPDPSGGVFVRDASGAPNGVLLEIALEVVSAAVPLPTLDEMVEAILRAGHAMADLGIGAACDMMTGRFHLERELEAYEIAAAKGNPIRTRLYVQWREVFGPKGFGVARLREWEAKTANPDRNRISGIKIFADGAIASATAAIYGSYTGASANGPILSRGGVALTAEVSGQLIYKPERLKEMTQVAAAAGYPVAIHAIGDYAVDLVLDAFESTDSPSDHRLEHAMLLSDAQIERIAKCGCFLTFQPEFLLRFGHAYLRQLGPERTALLKRSRSVIDAGIPLSFNSDRPIVPGDPRDGIRTAVNRPEAFSPAENISFEEAFLAYTHEGARITGDENMFGCIKKGNATDVRIASDPME